MNTLKQALLALLTALTLLMGFAHAEAQNAQNSPERDESWFYPVLYARGSYMHLLTDEQLDTIAKMPSEEIHAIVEAMFLAAAGVEEKAEIALWKTYKTEDEREARSLQNAAYRAQTLPWLLEAYAPGNRPDVVEEGLEYAIRPTATPVPTPRPTPSAATPTPAPTAAPDPHATPAPPQWTLEDGIAAFEENEFGQIYLDMLEGYGGKEAEHRLAVTQAIVQRWLAEIDHEKLHDQNRHYQFWLYAPATNIDHPVVQCGNNDYYLDHMFNRKYNKAGTLFMDYRNLTDFRDPNTLIYGHHMRNRSMFYSLTNYDTDGYYEAHPFMMAMCPEEVYVIEVFAAYVTDSRDHCYDIAISDEEDMRRFTATAAKKSDFASHVEIDCGKDHMVTLSTCAYNFENARYIVIGRLDLAWEKNPMFTAED